MGDQLTPTSATRLTILRSSSYPEISQQEGFCGRSLSPSSKTPLSILSLDKVSHGVHVSIDMPLDSHLNSDSHRDNYPSDKHKHRSLSVSRQQLRVVSSKIVGGAKKSVKAVESVFDDFVSFLNRGNVMDLAVGVIMGGVFTAVVTSFVVDLVTPIIGLLTQSNLENTYVILRCPANDTQCSNAVRWGTPVQANIAGAVTWNYGKFIQTCINFLITSAIIFFMVKIYTAAFRKRRKETVKTCLFCTKSIPKKAQRCPECTSTLETPEDHTDEHISKRLKIMAAIKQFHLPLSKTAASISPEAKKPASGWDRILKKQIK
ncbi:hypothetical protein BDV3_005363 [Batrachochytrium dendrobatidis]|nr:hypothetical protein O5D80_003431 [Batrachochytrium dendrobatidis]KAK5667008.1 hypothetical protein QVD99_006226 [Batrachochytrium dendrobatidis]